MDAQFPETLQEAVVWFGDRTNSMAFMKTLRWPDGRVCCPRCGVDAVTFLETRTLWKCRACAKQFSVKAGTIFEDSPLGLDKWLCAVWVIVNAKNGCSSCELGRALGVTQKTAWFMLHRIRLALHEGTVDKMSGQVEADETFIGGKARFTETMKKLVTVPKAEILRREAEYKEQRKAEKRKGGQ